MPEFIGLIPEELLYPEKVEDFLIWLIQLDVDPWTKKYIYLDFCHFVGIAVDKEHIDLFTGEAEITWG